MQSKVREEKGVSLWTASKLSYNLECYLFSSVSGAAGYSEIMSFNALLTGMHFFFFFINTLFFSSQYMEVCTDGLTQEVGSSIPQCLLIFAYVLRDSFELCSF